MALVTVCLTKQYFPLVHIIKHCQCVTFIYQGFIWKKTTQMLLRIAVHLIYAETSCYARTSHY